jgi:hypothetical protein
MKVINTDGLALIGPGSEWLWAMLTLVMLTSTFVAIYRQLRAQVAANALQKMQFLEDRWESDRMAHARLGSALDLKYRKPSAHMEPAMVQVADYWETIAQLHEDGHLRLHDVQSWGRSIQMWWALLAPAIKAERDLQHAPVYDGWEKLDHLMREADIKAGVPFQLDSTTLPRILDNVIRLNTGRLRMALEVNSGVIPSAPVSAATS